MTPPGRIVINLQDEEDMLETLEGHVYCVLDQSDWEQGDKYPDDPPLAEEFPEAFGSWCFVAGYAHALGMTSDDLIAYAGIDIQKLMEEADNEVLQLTEKGRAEVAKRAGEKSDYLKSFDCPSCHGKGWVHIDFEDGTPDGVYNCDCAFWRDQDHDWVFALHEEQCDCDGKYGLPKSDEERAKR